MTCEHGATPCTRIYPSRWPGDPGEYWCRLAGDLECSPVLEAERDPIADVFVILADAIERGDHTG